MTTPGRLTGTGWTLRTACAAGVAAVQHRHG